MYTIAVVILAAIIAYLIFRLLKQKVPKPKKSISTGDYEGNKVIRNIAIIIFATGAARNIAIICYDILIGNDCNFTRTRY